MKFSLGILAALVVCGSALALTPAPGPKSAPPQRQPGVVATSPDQPPALEKPDPEKEAAIRHLTDITQTSKLGDNITNAITAQVRAVMSRNIQQPEQLQKFMDAFTQKFLAAAPPSAVTDAEIPIYAHYFSLEDIQGLIKFYESPLGQRVVKTLPEVAQQTQQAGVQIDQKAALDVLRSMSAEYPELKPMLPQEPGAGPSQPPMPGPGPSGAPGTPGTPPQK